MKLVTFEVNNEQKFGIYTEEGIVDLSAKTGLKDIKSALEENKFESLSTYANDAVDYKMDEVKLLPVVTNPSKIFCAGVNYDEHRLETKRDHTQHPTIFFRVPRSQVAHNAPMIIPHESERFDFEGEIAIVINKEGRRISQEDAYDYIAGYSCYNDGSVRDYQLHTSQWGPGKNFEHTGAFGPWLVTADEFEPGEVLTLETRLNGEVMQKADTSLLLFSIPELIEYVSSFITLEPGDVIVTGTPGGVGAKRQPPVFMKDGDIVEVEVSKIGILTNPIKSEKLMQSEQVTDGAVEVTNS
ncbi:fumarylacetoacetate hydrolase family protein [Psychrobacillus soli]|uniref:Fumarylacetoacetate hydrolase family protein n=1 Tax=Psychrobacillus soli TaxID=1543965 RepID=A0A544TN47_9BACI|nr:fumarylacetoacetate hydrolase family protein [Psychrobacillus soli]TQR18835.1 fumarylacetoacetate hydrolase family protein [Psychrobacillus soli]